MQPMIIGIIIAFGLLIYMWCEAHRNTIKQTEITLEGFPKSFNGLKLFFISDIHRRTLSANIISKLEHSSVDLIVIGGDIMEKGVPFDRVENNIKALTKIAPVYFVWGNNDYESDYRRLDVLLREHHVKILDNTAVCFETEKEKLILLGVDDVGTDRDRLDLALQDAEDGYRILISHNPDITQKVRQVYDIGFVISGHTHGGQIRLFQWGIREKGGVKERNGVKLLISNGYGTTTIPFRFCAPAETHLLTLKDLHL
jgi:predicted MPP superfamily phosphohydrolase